MKNLLYVILGLLVLWLVNSYFGFLASAALVLVFILITAYRRRASILTQLATKAYYINGDKVKGRKYYEKAYKTGEMNAQCKISFSSFCLRENDFERGERLLNEIINSRRTSTEEKLNAKHNMAVLQWKKGDLEGAIKTLDIVHREAPQTNTYGTLGVLYLERAKKDGNFEEILPFMIEAYEYNDSDKTIADNLGELYFLTGEYEKADELYKKLITKEFTTPMPYYNHGRVLKALGRTEDARESFEKALTCRFTSVMTVTKEDIERELESL